MSIVIKNAIILTQDNKRKQINGDIYIQDENITTISTKPITTEAEYKIDGRKKNGQR